MRGEQYYQCEKGLGVPLHYFLISTCNIFLPNLCLPVAASVLLLFKRSQIQYYKQVVNLSLVTLVFLFKMEALPLIELRDTLHGIKKHW